MKKITFDIIFIIISGILLMVLHKYGLIEKYMAFALIPILVAYRIGQYSERKFKNKETEKAD